MNSFSTRVRELRKAAGLTQPEFAKIISTQCGQEITRSAVSMWELGQRTPKMDVVIAIAAVFGVTADSLLLASAPQPEAEETMPEITMIARAGRKMSPERRKDMLKLLRIAFPEEFRDD